MRSREVENRFESLSFDPPARLASGRGGIVGLRPVG
jgi:hypothetical protein